jgi:hypothetical protein
MFENPKKSFPIFPWLMMIGLAAIAPIFAIQFKTRWEWSFLMDDVAYLRWMPKVSHLLPAFLNDVKSYWSAGRFYPVKYLTNLLKWRYLPLSPSLFHGVDLVLLLMILACGSYLLMEKRHGYVPMLAGMTFLIGLGFLQRPLLDTVALNSIAEPWVILFFVLGLSMFPNWAWGYRLCFLLAGLSKEPAVIVFLASGFAHLILIGKNDPNRFDKIRSAVIDVVLFIGLAVIMKMAQNHGSYLHDYSLWKWWNLRQFLVGGIKCTLGLLPVALLFILAGRGGVSRLIIERRDMSFLVLCGIFGTGYLFLAATKGIAGYLLIPASFAFFIVGGFFALSLFPRIQWTGLRAGLFCLLFVLSGFVTMWRYVRYIQSINESTAAMHRLLRTSQPRLILINGGEAAGLGQTLALDEGAPVKVREFDGSPSSFQPLADYHGEVVVFELTQYFGRYPQAALERTRQICGGWQRIEDENVFRLFYGRIP